MCTGAKTGISKYAQHGALLSCCDQAGGVRSKLILPFSSPTHKRHGISLLHRFYLTLRVRASGHPSSMKLEPYTPLEIRHKCLMIRLSSSARPGPLSIIPLKLGFDSS